MFCVGRGIALTLFCFILDWQYSLFECIMLCERSQIRKVTQCMIPSIMWQFWKLISCFLGLRWQEGPQGERGWLKRNTREFGGSDRNVLGFDHGRGDMTACIYQTQNCTLEKLKCTQIMPQILKILEVWEQVCMPRETMKWIGRNERCFRERATQKEMIESPVLPLSSWMTLNKFTLEP